MGLFEQFPYTNYHDLNLDWIIQKVKEAYSPDNPPDNVVLSVNGQTGAVILYQNAVVQLPTTDEDTWNIFRKADGSDQGIQFIKGQPAQRIAGTNRYNIYDQGNPPPYPVTSVDGSTGAVTTWANTGNDTLTIPHEAEGDSWALRREGPSGYLGIEFDLDDNDDPTGFFILKPDGQSLQKVKILTESDIPSEAGVVSINGEAGIVVLYAGDIAMASGDSTTVKAAIENAAGLTAAEYNSSSSYSAGDFCSYLGILYVCTGSTTGSFDPTKWTATTAGAQIKAVKSAQATDASNISTLQGQMSTANTNIGKNSALIAYVENGSTSSTNYTVGQYIARNGSLYKVIANISAGDQFTGSNVAAVDNVGNEITSLYNNMKQYQELYDFNGTSSATVNLTDSANKYLFVSFIVYDSNGQIINSVTVPTVYMHNTTTKIYGDSSSVWGSVSISDDYTQATFNRTSATTSKVRLIGTGKIL